MAPLSHRHRRTDASPEAPIGPRSVPRFRSLGAIVLAAVALAGCDLLGIESPEKAAAARDADGRAIGGACRHAARAIEDCYALNKKADKAAVFAGWRDMNDYMRENKIEPVSPQMAASAASPKPDVGEAAGDDKRPRKSADAAKSSVKAKAPDS